MEIYQLPGTSGQLSKLSRLEILYLFKNCQNFAVNVIWHKKII